MDTILRLAAIEEIKTVKARYLRTPDQKDEARLRGRSLPQNICV